MKQTEQVQSLLSGIFDSNEIVEPILDAKPLPSNSNSLHGLDDMHTKLFINITKKPDLRYNDFIIWCKALSLIPGGAVEVLNEAAFEICNDILVDIDSETIEINTDTLTEMIECRK